MSMPASPKNILLIVSAARSGSTLLSLLLGTMKGACNAGELFHFFDRGLAENHYCGCGERVRSCPFWTGVVEAADLSMVPEEARDAHLTLRQALRKHSLWPRYGVRNRVAAQRAYSLTRQLYGGIHQKAGGDWIIDSSKQPIYARYLIDTFGWERVHILHLVRDPRGVAHSAAKRRLKTDTGDPSVYMNRRGYMQSAYQWAKLQVSAELLKGKAAGYCLLRYEDMCTEGEAAVARAVSALDPDLRERFALAATARAAGQPWGGDQHTVSGNPIRVGAGALAVTPDMEWRDKLPVHAYAGITALTAPLLLRYGYALGRV